MHHYIKDSLDVLSRYDGSVPFHHFIRYYFRKDKKYGSRDRRSIRELCYAWFRSGNMFSNLPDSERLLYSLYLTSSSFTPVLRHLFQQSGEQYNVLDETISLEDKLKIISRLNRSSLDSLFPFTGLLSPMLNSDMFVKSMLLQPVVWLRVRTGFMEHVEEVLKVSGVNYQKHANRIHTLSVPATTDLDSLGVLDQGWVEVQDLSSQKTIDFMHARNGEAWLDACAASGGKSLLLMDAFPDLNLTVNDTRESVLKNLEVRFKRNGISSFRSFVCDLSTQDLPLEAGSVFDGILADVPCSGSGTWSRTPERMKYFSESELLNLIDLQDAITRRLYNYLAPGGRLVYITCSVFSSENEDRVKSIASMPGMQLRSMELIQGALEKADTLFCAEIVKLD